MKKKNFTRFLASVLVLIQVFTLAVCFNLTASAEETDATPTADYIFYPTTETMTLDGNANEKIWSNVPVKTFGNGVTFKGTYVKTAEKTTAYFLFEYVDIDADASLDGFYFVMDATDEDLNAGSPVTAEDGTTTCQFKSDGSTWGRFQTSHHKISSYTSGTVYNSAWTAVTKFAIQDGRATNQKVSIEISYDIKGQNGYFHPEDGKFGFNMLINHNSGSGFGQSIMLGNSSTFRSPAAVLEGYLATVEPNMLAGAGMRLATDINDSGLRFETQINKANYDALVAAGATVTTGTLILPTESIPAGTLTKQALLEAGAVDVVNKDNGWVNAATAESDGYYTFYGSIVKIKEANLTKAFSGISYVTVTQDGNSVTYLSNYNEADHSRDVKTVAAAVKASGDYSAYETILDAYLQ